MPSFDVYSTNTSKTGTFTLSLANTIEVGSGQGQTTTSFAAISQSYTLTVSNPCLTEGIIDIVVFNPTSITVTDGYTFNSEFVIPSDDVDDTYTGTLLCGTKNYAITAASAPSTAITTWAAITDSATSGSKTLRIDPDQYGSHISSKVTETLTITTTFANWA